MTTKTSTADPERVPYSWSLRTWETLAAHVWPGNGKEGQRILRHYRADLQAAGALSRPGREIVFLGAGYARWLTANAPRVINFDVPMNRPEHAHKRFGGKERRHA